MVNFVFLEGLVSKIVLLTNWPCWFFLSGFRKLVVLLGRSKMGPGSNLVEAKSTELSQASNNLNIKHFWNIFPIAAI